MKPMLRCLEQIIPLLLFIIVLSTACLAEDSCEQAATAVSEASKLRGLAPKQAVSCRTVSQDEFIQLATKLILEDTDKENLQIHGDVLYYQGLIPYDYDYAGCIAKALASNAAAFYSWRLKQFVVPNWKVTSFPILVHEAVHALQDQHYQISRFARKKFIFDDENVAQGSILEGDASIWESISKRRHPNEPLQGDEGSPIEHECELPPQLLHLFDSMYEQGADYMGFIWSDRRKLEQLLKKPIQTTRAVMRGSVIDESETLTCLVPNIVVEGRIGVFGVTEFLQSRTKASYTAKVAGDLTDDCFAANLAGMYRAKYRFQHLDSAIAFYNAAVAYWITTDSRIKITLTGPSVSIEVL